MSEKVWLWLRLTASTALAGALRCGNALLSTAESQSEPLTRCGSPLAHDDKLETRTGNNGNKQTVTIGEMLTLAMGKSHVMQRVTIENGLISQIEEGPRHN